MVNDSTNIKTHYFKNLATLLFFLLALGVESLIAYYWFRVLEPQLMAKAEITARALAQPSVGALAGVLDLAGKEDPVKVLREMERAVDQIMLLTDPQARSPFICRIEVIVDYDAVAAPKGSLNLNRTNLDDDDFFVTETPVYSQVSRELLGVVRLHNSRKVFRYFKQDVQTSFIAGAVIVFLLLAFAWGIVTGLLERIRRTEEELREKQAQIVHAGRLTAMGEMATGIAHEINQPLAIIRVAADGLNEFFSGSANHMNEAREARKIVAQVERAASIINNMRSFVRTGVEQTDAVDLRGSIENALSFFREQFRIHGIRFNVDLPGEPVRVKVNPGKFQQIVVNLLSNARHAVEEKSNLPSPYDHKEITVRLAAEKSTGVAVLEVADNGIGMSQTVQERCLEPFFTTKEVGEGTGLGLSIAHGLAREFGMKLEVTSAEGKGSIFRVCMTVEKE
jgi:signal transduction histidine kinase